MSKSVKGVLIGIPVVIVAVIVVLYFSLNSIVKNGVEAVGPRVLGADVVLQKANISLFSGKGQLKGIMIGNPKGFKSESAIKLGEVRVAVDLSSVLSNKIVINEILIDAPEITYETSGGKNNIEALLENINDFTGTSEDKEDASQKSEKKVQINDFIVSNAKVNLSATILQGEKFTVPMADIHLEDIGKDDEGAGMSDVLKEVFAKLNGNIAGAVAAPLTSTGKTVEKTMDKLKGLFGK